MGRSLKKLLSEAIYLEASDIHLTIGKPPVLRIHGELITLDQESLKPEDIKEMVEEVLPEALKEQLETNREVDFSYGIPGVSRFRLNAYYQRSHLSMAIRVIQVQIPSLEDLAMPSVLKTIAEKKQGLVLVTGPTGSGKSTTLAAMIKHMNENVKKHIITLEDPIEYLHKHRNCIIDQREVGSDTKSFSTGLRSALRQDPDVILVGEMRDLDTIATAITAAETGHLVLGTLHTSSAAATIDRIIDVFQPSQQAQIRIQLASVLAAVISQRLLTTVDRRGRKAATEILVNNYAIANLIRNEKIHQIENVLQTSRSEGMHTLEMSIRQLLTDRLIDYEEAKHYIKER
ncbi:type IV pilus twitching motility protein PilT [Evansella cellulosilytica]|uniref:Twitching motility protein n=1 Tax=Evansella cellulosilytica (strain ATCC 21833 / DSM 2522 / FERM P-1141 / JCM 9156 / N-4) TaxID=649639 RepID=E6TZN9_EVAC2|nr:type IV pilus twitching motility protein PilT [Evansella cellulosilytica]ADU31345.1 twitching motility protein [Evansella cellulosilytica DSM 2522]